MRVTVEKMVAGGDCIGKIDGKIVFVSESLPGETLDIEITQEKKDFLRARILAVIAPSPHRTVPHCPLFGRCGGCNLQITDYSYQLELKTNLIRDAFFRAGFERRQPLPEIRVIPSAPWEYRSRFQLHRVPDSAGQPAFGLVSSGEAGTLAVLPVDDCPVAVPAIRALLKKNALTGCGERFTIFAENTGDMRVVTAQDSVSECAVSLLDKTIRFDARGFFQSNIPLTEKIIKAVYTSLADDDSYNEAHDDAVGGANHSALDLYSGCGTFAAFLGDIFAKTILVEQNKDALAWADVNLHGKEYRAFGMSGAAWVRNKAAQLHYAAVVADPPRAGLERAVRDWLCNAHPADRLRYVSCNPVTLARDAVFLADAGYELSSLTFFDFYPQTSHIEALACFERGTLASRVALSYLQNDNIIASRSENG